MQKMTHWTKMTYVCQGKNIFPRAFQSLTKCSYFLITFWLQIKRIIVAELQAQHAWRYKVIYTPTLSNQRPMLRLYGNQFELIMQRKSIDWFLYGWNMEKMYLEIFFAYRDLIRLSSVMLPLLAITWVFGVFRMVNNDKFSKYMFHVFNIVQVSIHLHFNLLFLRYMDQKITVSAKSFWHR